MANHHIVVGDAHAKPGVSNRRFRWLGLFVADFCEKYINDNVTVIDMGDWEDMPSLSSYDIGKKSYEGRRYQKDIQAAVDARIEFQIPLIGINNKRQAAKKKKISPNLVALGGNHFERRIERAIENSPLLDGVISIDDGRAVELGWEYTPFLVPKDVDGITYVHYWQGRGTSQPIGMGKFPAQTLLREKHCSSVIGHNHVWDVAVSRNGAGDKLFALSAGCFLDPEQDEAYAGQNNRDWTRCITVLKDVRNGFPEGGFEMITIEELKDRYAH